MGLFENHRDTNEGPFPTQIDRERRLTRKSDDCERDYDRNAN